MAASKAATTAAKLQQQHHTNAGEPNVTSLPLQHAVRHAPAPHHAHAPAPAAPATVAKHAAQLAAATQAAAHAASQLAKDLASKVGIVCAEDDTLGGWWCVVLCKVCMGVGALLAARKSPGQ